MNNPHDVFFRKSLSNHKVAESFFKKHLPADILRRVNLPGLELQPVTMIDKKLSQRFSDMIFQVPIDGTSGYIYLLVEHQSGIDKNMPFRLLNYQIQLMDRHLQEHASDPLPVVLPIVVYNGKKQYSGDTDIYKLFGVHEKLARQTLCEPFQLVDLTQISDTELEDSGWSALLTLLLKHARHRSVLEVLKKLELLVLEIWQCDDNDYIISSIYYMLGVENKQEYTDNEVAQTFGSILAEMGGKTMSIAEVLRQQGMQQGMQQGKRELAEALIKVGVDADLVERLANISNDVSKTATTQNS